MDKLVDRFMDTFQLIVCIFTIFKTFFNLSVDNGQWMSIMGNIRQNRPTTTDNKGD